MSLTADLIFDFVKATKDSTTTKTETTVYGTVVDYDNSKWVRIDGSDRLTPIQTTVNINNEDRVIVSIKNHTATITGNLTTPSATTKDVDDISNQISDFEIIIADKVSTEELEVERGRIDTLVSENVIIKESLSASNADISDLTSDYITINEKLTATEAVIEDLKTTKLDAEIADITYATIKDLDTTNATVNNLSATYGEFAKLTTDKLNANDASIKNLETSKLDAETANITYAKISTLESDYAKITDLNATNANVSNLTADVADIDTLIFGSASGTTIQTSFANAVIAQLGNAQIKSAMIESISASKITAGDIITNNVRVMSEDGSLLISDETIQISDETRVRVQIGKDAANDYSINIWDADGNLMFSEGGITDSAIKDAIIRNDMVANNANISASKLDIDSLFEEINGSSKTIKSTKIYLDDEGQTLDVAFTSMTTEVGDLSNTVSTQGTQISTIQGQISSKIWQQDIDAATNELEETTETLSTQYSTLNQEVDSISATVASHTTQISNKADSSEVTAVSDRVTSVEQNLDGFKTTVSSTYATKAVVNTAVKEVHQYYYQNESVILAETSPVYDADNQMFYIYDAFSIDAGKQYTVNWNGVAYSCVAQEIIEDGVSIHVLGDISNMTGGESTGEPFLIMEVPSEYASDMGGITGQMAAWDGSTSVTLSITGDDGTIPEKPTTYPPSSDWTETEPRNSDISMYSTLCTVYMDNSFSYSDVSTSTAIEAAINANRNAGSAQINSDAAVRNSLEAIGRADYASGLANDNKNDLSKLTTRVTNTESSIEQNSESITSLVSRTEVVENKFANYSTTSEMNSAIEQSASEINSSVSATYATKTALNTTNTNVTNAANAAAAAQSTADTAKTNAATAQSTANTAKTNAATAQSAAEAAQTTANTAKTNAATAQSTAEAAQSAADAAQDDVDTLAENVSTNYATKSEVTQTANEISSTVSATTTIANKALNQSVEYIVGTQTAATNAWTGVSTSDSLYTGKTIAYKLPYAGTSSAATLNLTLADGSTTGAKGIRRINSTVTTTYAAGAVINMTYDGTYWRLADYDANTYDRVRYNQAIKCGTTAIVAANIIVGANGVYKHLKAGTAFDISYPILYASSAIAASATGTNNYLCIPFAVKTTQSLTLTAYKPVYIKGTLSGKMFTPVSTTPLTQTEPTSNDGYFYMLLGTAYSTTNMYLTEKHPMYKYDANNPAGFKAVEQILLESQTRISQTESSITSLVSTTDSLGTRTSTLEQTAEGFTASITELESDVSTAQSTANTAKTNAATAQSTANTATTIAKSSPKKINTHMRNFTKANWEAYGTAGHSESWTTGSNYDNSHIYVGDIAYIVGTVSDAGGSNTVSATIYGTVTSKSTSAVVMTTLYYIMGGEGGAYALANTANTNATNAAKTATNYLNFSSSGLVIGDMTASTLGRNVLIDSDSVDIRNGSTILASYSDSKIQLGVNSTSSIIELCGGTAVMKYHAPVNNRYVFDIMSDNPIWISSPSNVYTRCSIDNNTETIIANIDLSTESGDGATVSIGTTYYTMDGNTEHMTSMMFYNGYININTDNVELNINTESGWFGVGGNLKVSGTTTLSGNLSGKYLTGTWLQTTSSANLNSATSKVAVLDSSGWVYYRTPAEILSDAGVTSTVAELNYCDGVTSNIQTQLNTKMQAGTLYASTLAYFVWGVYQASPSAMCYSGRLKDEGGWGPKGFACWYQFYATMQNAPDGTYSVDVFTILEYGNETYIGCITGTSSFSVSWQKLAKVMANSAWDNPNGQALYIASGDETNYRLFLGVSESNWTVCPQTDRYLRLGSPSYRWGTIYSGSSTVSTSDRTQKENISKLTDIYVKLFTKLQPVSFEFIDGTSGRTHIGFVSQDVEEAMIECGLSDLDFAGFCKDPKYTNVETVIEHEIVDPETGEVTIEKETKIESVPVEGEYIYSLRYEEFIALNTHMIQNLYTEYTSLKSEIETIRSVIGI